jgi:hypothetical protein
MVPNVSAVATVAAMVTIGGPIVLGLAGAIRCWREASRRTEDDPGWDWRLVFASGLLYSLAFSLIFFVQELFLVVPKALTPGLRPTLFHNNHGWEGENPLARLFQGTGALAIVLTAIGFAFWLWRRPPRSSTVRLFVIWMAFHGFFESIPQVVVGAMIPQNDMGMAMDYLGLSPAAKAAAALVALAAIAIIGLGFTRPLLELAQHPGDTGSAAARMRFILRIATLPALASVPLIVLFRVPGTVDQVVLVPAAVTVIGISWVQAGAWRVASLRSCDASPVRSVWHPLIAVTGLFTVFHLVLRPGINFF